MNPRDESFHYKVLEHSEIVNSEGGHIVQVRLQYTRTLTKDWRYDPHHFEKITIENSEGIIVFQMTGMDYYIEYEIYNNSYDLSFPHIDTRNLPRPVTIQRNLIIKIPSGHYIVNGNRLYHLKSGGPFKVTIKGVFDEVIRLESVVEFPSQE